MKKQVLNRVVTFAVICLCVVSVYAQNYSFSSYHIYTNDDDKYLTTNIQNDSLKVCIDEVNHEIELSFYIREVKKWKTFAMQIGHKIDIGIKTKIGTLYLCVNNAGQTCGACVVNTDEGILIDLRNFYIGEQTLNCWVKLEK